MDIGQLGSVVLPGSTAPSTLGPAAAAPTPVSGTAASTGSAATTAITKTSAAAQAASANQEPSIGQVNQAVQKINAALQAQSQSQGIEFSVDSSSHRIVVEVVDQQTNQVLRQYPSKEALAIADSLNEDPTQSQPQGLLIKQQA